ncbi:LacI family transcriptional regulator [Stella humosa]|uniref:LacI family transcriptional regulator n=2 Tax=Stella humosa TaxID=94 RepID=A0A3N1MLR5_9PROT|nr:LacI family transcriptional regulator [Stella humosa]BBK32325.1 LacI family transcriptional regulator [Stella humosa]
MARARPVAVGDGQGTVRLADVAAAAGVSSATVSRAFNLPALVREDVRARILATADDLGYVAHGAARALASKRSRTLGAIVPTLNNTIFARAIDAFQRRVEERGYILLLTTSEYDQQREWERARAMVERGVDGLMLVGGQHDPRLLHLLEVTGKPFINTWTANRGAEHASVGYDSRALSNLVFDYLVGLGHREFAVVTGSSSHNDRVAGRLLGMADAVRRHGLAIPPARMIHRRYSIDEGRCAFRQLAASGPLPTAIVCGNDILACGVLFEALAAGIDVPGRLSIMGNGDLDIAAHTSPGLSTVLTPKVEIGNWAADYLVACLEGREIDLPPELPVTLVLRGTTGPLSA